MKKIIKKNPTKAKRLSLVALIICYFVFAFVAMLCMPLIAWCGLGVTLLSIIVIWKAIQVEFESQSEKFSELKSMFEGLTPPVEECSNETEEN